MNKKATILDEARILEQGWKIKRFKIVEGESDQVYQVIKRSRLTKEDRINEIYDHSNVIGNLMKEVERELSDLRQAPNSPWT